MKYNNFRPYSLIRELAKTDKYQALYSQAKELHLKLFLNEFNFTDKQLMFLNYLSFYASLNLDVALGDVEEIVFENEIYEDAYAFYRNSERKKDKKLVDNKGNKNQKNQSGNTDSWIFKSKKKLNK